MCLGGAGVNGALILLRFALGAFLHRVAAWRVEVPSNRVAQVPTLPGSLQHAALAADVRQRLMTAWADRRDLTAPGGGVAGVAVLDGEGEGLGRGSDHKTRSDPRPESRRPLGVWPIEG